MRYPNVKQTELSGDKPQYRVFISYSRADSDLAREFYSRLRIAFENKQSVFGSEQIFFDSEGIYAGDILDKVILPALDESLLVIFLASGSSLDPTRYCWKEEIPRAVTSGKTIIPVILSPCLWKGAWIARTNKTRTLNDQLAIPTAAGANGESVITPIECGKNNFHDRASRWDECCLQILRTCRKLVSAPCSVHTETAKRKTSKVPGRSDPRRLLPALCDQVNAQSELEKSLIQWHSSRSLFFLVQGCEDDEVLNFWERVIRHGLLSDGATEAQTCAEACRDLLLPQVQSASILSGRFVENGDSSGSESNAELLMLHKLNASVAGHTHRYPMGHIDKAATEKSLRTQLELINGIQPVQCLLSHSQFDGPTAVSSIATFARALASLPDDIKINRLAFGFIWTGSEDLSTSFRQAINGASPSRYHPVALSKLVPFDRTDVQHWYRTKGLDTWMPVEEDQFIAAAFHQEQSTIRFKHLFAAYRRFSNNSNSPIA